MSDERLREAPAQRFDASHLSFDLRAELADLLSEPTEAKHGHRQKTLFKYHARTIALFALDAGAELREHSTSGTITIEPIEGDLIVTVEGDERPLRAGQLLVLAPDTPHAVRAVTTAAFVLQISLSLSD